MATTEQLMAHYGVAWFGFDEESGNVYDKLGLNNYVGTVTGATRIDSWNGEGYAMNFDGASNKITMNSNNIIPLLESTIKFKINTTQRIDNAAIFHQGYNTTTHGIRFYMINTGQLGIMILANAIANQSYLVSKSIIADGKWHEIHFTYDGTLNKNGMKLFIDEELETIGGKLILPVQSSSETMIFGWGNTASPRWFNGQLDDLQIYNKALSPSDFEQKRLAIKSESNKNLVLSPTSTRVKEIPNTEENTLLAQGGVIREIDSAIDRPPIDLTRASTEYEIVSNTKSPLNNGKIFTIPIDNNFKTAFIEDNY